MQKSYANFKDPFGLLKRMLLSRDRAARSALYRAAAMKFVGPLDLMLEKSERRLLQEENRISNLPIIFVVGAPRSGTTLLHQTLARYLPMTYFTNLSALFPRAPLTASLKFARFLKAKRFDDRSFYGNVAGWAAPNDGFHVWNRWLGTDRYRAPQQISASAAREMRTFFNAWLAAFEQPFINKNNRNTDCVALLASIFDHACFIEVRRHPVYVAQSLLQARQQIQGSAEIGWGLHSADSSSGKGHIDEICEQVFSIEKKLRTDKQRVAPGRYMEVSYERFCQNPRELVQKIARTFLQQELDESALRQNLRPFRVTNEIRIGRMEFDQIQKRIEALYGASALSKFEDYPLTHCEALPAAPQL